MSILPLPPSLFNLPPPLLLPLPLHQVQVSTITNQSWELPVHPGNMVASNSNYIAYVLEGRSGYVVRLIHRHTNSRTLLKGFTGPVLDVAFSPSAASLLACVDQGGNLFVWDLSKTDSGLSDVNRYVYIQPNMLSLCDEEVSKIGKYVGFSTTCILAESACETLSQKVPFTSHEVFGYMVRMLCWRSY